MSYIKDKVIIVTGGSRGIGFVTVQHLLRHGAAYVAIFDVAGTTSETVAEMTQTLEGEFGKAKFGYYVCDVTNDKDFIACYEDVAKSHNYVDVLVNNAGVCNENDPDLTIAVNFSAVVKCTLAAMERMGKHRGRKGGSVVNIASIYGLTNVPLIPIYNATKHAVVSFVRSMKEHNETLGMRIVCVCPGLTRTNMTTRPKGPFLPDFVPEEMIKAREVKYLQSPDNVASAVASILEKGKEGEVWLAQNDEPPIIV